MEESPEASSAPGTSGKARTSGRLRTGRREFWLSNDAEKTTRIMDFPDIALLEKQARSQAEQSASARPTGAQSGLAMLTAKASSQLPCPRTLLTFMDPFTIGDGGEEPQAPLPSPRALRLEARRASLAGAGSGQAGALPSHPSGSPLAGARAALGQRSPTQHAAGRERQGPGASPAACAAAHEAGQGLRSAGRLHRSQQRLSTDAAAVEHKQQDEDAAGPSHVLSPSRPVTRSLKTAEGASPSKCPSPYTASATLAPGVAAPSGVASAKVPAGVSPAAAGTAAKASHAAKALASPLASPAAAAKPPGPTPRRNAPGKGPSPPTAARGGRSGPSQPAAYACEAPAADATAAAVALEPQEQPARQKSSPAKMPKRKLDPVLASQIMLLDFDPDAASGRRSQPRGARSGRDAGRTAAKAAAGASQGSRSAMPQLAGHSGLGAGAAVAVHHGAEPDVGLGMVGAVGGGSRRHGRSAKPQGVRPVESGPGNAGGSSRAHTEPPFAAAGLLGAHETDGQQPGKAGKAAAAGAAGAGAKGLAAKGGGWRAGGPASVPPNEPARGNAGLGAGQDSGAGQGAQHRAPTSGQVQVAARLADDDDDEEEAQRASKRRRKGSARPKSGSKAGDAQGAGPAMGARGGAAGPGAADQRAAVTSAGEAGVQSVSQVTGSVGAGEGAEPSGRRRSARLASSGRPPGGEAGAGPSTAQRASAPPARATRSSARGPAIDERDPGTVKPAVSHRSAGQEQRAAEAASAGQATAATAAGACGAGVPAVYPAPKRCSIC